jgi:hypothetical protein
VIGVRGRCARPAVAALLALLAGKAVLADPPAAPKPDEAWNRVFDRTDGWTGGDVAGSIDLRDGRTLWVFGDTWVGPIRDGKRVRGSRLVNNSIAVHPTDLREPWRPPAVDSVTFHWAQEDRKPAAWVRPRDEPQGSPPTADRDEWFWPTGGGLVATNAAGQPRLAVFLFRVRRNPRGEGIWKFAVAGSAVAIIDNPGEPPDRWTIRVAGLQSASSPSPQSPPETTVGPAETEFTWGMAACRPPGDRPTAAGSVLIYGVRKIGKTGRGLILARAAADAIDDFSRWEFCSGAGRWSANEREARSLADGLTSEFSLAPFPPVPAGLGDAQPSLWLLVQSEGFFGRRILARTAPRPEGPWSPGAAAYTVPDVAAKRAYFTYAAKGHSRLSRPNELLVTYLVNSNRFADLMTDTTIYRPKFVRIPAASLRPR